MTKDYSNSDHLGDGLYVHFNGFSYELSVNHHENPTVATFEEDHIDALLRFKERMQAVRKQKRDEKN